MVHYITLLVLNKTQHNKEKQIKQKYITYNGRKHYCGDQPETSPPNISDQKTKRGFQMQFSKLFWFLKFQFFFKLNLENSEKKNV